MPCSARRPSRCSWPTWMARVKSFSRRLLVCLPVLTRMLGAQVGDGSYQRPLFTWRDAILAGGFAIGTVAIRPLDKSAAVSLQRPYSQQQKLLRTTSAIVRTIAEPGSVIIGTSMYAVGRVSHSD